ncbi:hypothetical protein EG327_006952 [Venturia inaequalis]|uniref:aspartate kinase n=1 Tax=Venturia inaequalis TaxID=5025 RepID=A0A8H3VSI2_VENIN|nr:hypothetical protein EG327_006952 [Venturia inaequalis]
MTKPSAPDPTWIVQKYGGTSLGKFPLDIANIIETSKKTNQIAVIVSARSGKIKAQGTTTRLLQALAIAEKLPGKPGRDAFLKIVDDIRQDHFEAARRFITSPDLQQDFMEFVEEECQSLIRKLGAVQENCEITPMNENRIVCKGEILGARFLVAVLEGRGCEARCVDLSDTIRDFGIATDVAEIDLYSDLTAALTAVGLNASALQIWKEIDGIFTADPRKAPTARLLPSITPSEAAELTFYGSEVINSVAMQQVVRAQIPIRVLNVIKPTGQGTMIAASPKEPTTTTTAPTTPDLTLSRGKPLADLTLLNIPKRPTAITVKRSVLLLNIRSNRKIGAPGFLSQVFQTLDRYNLSAAPIASSEVNVSLGLHSEIPMVLRSLDDAGEEKIIIKDKRLRKACEKLVQLGDVDIRTDMAILSLVGRGLKNMVGISGRFFGVLGEAGVNVEMISQDQRDGF